MNVGLDYRSGTPQQRGAFFRNLIGKLGALPGIDAVGAVNYLPLSHGESLGFFWVDGFANEKDQLAERTPRHTSVFSSDEHSAACGTVLYRGRRFEPGTANHHQPTICEGIFCRIAIPLEGGSAPTKRTILDGAPWSA